MISFADKVQCVELLGHIPVDNSAQLPFLGVLIQELDDFPLVVHWQQRNDNIFCSDGYVLAEGCHVEVSSLDRIDDARNEIGLD